jgi:hypothetical protein
VTTPLEMQKVQISDYMLDNMFDEDERRSRSLSIWNEAADPRGTPVELYLTGPRPERRSVKLPNEAAGEAIRYHASCPFRGVRTPAMVCLIRDVRTNEPKAIHRTALSLDGRKVHLKGADRLTFGPIRGGAIKLTPDEDVTLCLGVGEGIETTLSLRQRSEFGQSPVWSLISASGIKALPVLPGVECLWVAVDHDKKKRGQDAARAVGEQWQAAGREVFLVMPSEPGTDLNDLESELHYA